MCLVSDIFYFSYPSLIRFKFAHLRHPDTRHITAVQETCSQFAPSAETFVRKSSPAFMSYQQDDMSRKTKQRERVRF